MAETDGGIFLESWDLLGWAGTIAKERGEGFRYQGCKLLKVSNDIQRNSVVKQKAFFNKNTRRV